MRALLIVLALFLLVPALPSAVSAGEPDSLLELEKRLIAEANRLQALVEEASRDPRERKLEMYLRYSRKEMNSKKREVRAEHIIQWMSDGKANFEFRKACKDALKKGAQLLDDPDLSSSIKKRPGTNRGYFFAKQVAPLLERKDDRNTRTLAASLLKDVYGRVPSEPAIFNYNADNQKTWKKAVDTWKKHLKRK